MMRRSVPVLALATFVITAPLAGQPPRAPEATPPWMSDLWGEEAPPVEEPLPPELPERPLGLEQDVTAELARLEQSLSELSTGLEPTPVVADNETGIGADPAAARTAPAPIDDERAAFEELARTGHAPILARPTGAVFPFGRGVPTLTCLPDRACDLELEAGEVVDGLALGDTSRWQATQLFEGEATLKPHILLKPAEAGLKTNLVLVTNRRTYHIELEAVEADNLETGGEGEGAPYHHHVAFWYPESWVVRLRSEAEFGARRASEAQPGTAPLDDQAAVPSASQVLTAGALDFGYDVELPRKKIHRLPWRPVTVFDDGRRTYVVLPPNARAYPLPAVVGVLPGGGRFPLEVTLHGDWLVLPSLVDELELIHGTGEVRRSLVIRRRTPIGAQGGRS